MVLDVNSHDFRFLTQVLRFFFQDVNTIKKYINKKQINRLHLALLFTS